MSDRPARADAADPAPEPEVDAGGAVRSFHVGDVRQFVAPIVEQLKLRVPHPRPAFGTDEETGEARPDPTLAPAAEPRASATPEKPPASR